MKLPRLLPRWLSASQVILVVCLTSFWLQKNAIPLPTGKHKKMEILPYDSQSNLVWQDVCKRNNNGTLCAFDSEKDVAYFMKISKKIPAGYVSMVEKRVGAKS